MIGLANEKQLLGGFSNVTPIIWSSHRLKRVGSSSLSVEAQELRNMEDEMYFVRLQWAEFSGQLIDLRNAETHVRSIPRLAVIEAKSIYDVINSNNQVQGLTEKRTAVELMG